MPNSIVAAAWLIVVILVGALLVIGRDVLIPLALAVLIWQLINAIAARYRKVRIRGQTPNTWLRLTLAVATIVLALILVSNLIVDNVGAVTAAAPRYEQNLSQVLPHIAATFGLPAPPRLGEMLGHIDIGAWIGSISTTLGAFAGNIGLVALYVAFMLFEQESFDRKIDRLFPDPARAAEVRRLLGHMERRIERYLWIKTILSVLAAVLSWFVLLAVGVDYAAFWALIVFMLSYIPTIGAIFGVMFPALLTLLQFGAIGPFLVVTIGLGIIQFGLHNVLEPKLMGHSLNLSPVVMILSLAVWGSMWGVAGMFLCVPIMVIAMIICAHFTTTRPIALLMSATGELERDVPDPAKRAAPLPAAMSQA
ncbi:MAG: AI-2E family transporter [Geminicoccaceae bacterium]